MNTPPVLIECDRCHRDCWTIGPEPADARKIWINGLILPIARSGRNGMRPGAAIALAGGPRDGWRLRLSCTGRKHDRKHERYSRVVTMETADRAYAAAVSDGRDRIRLREI